MLDVVGNNLANINTNGYKAQRTLFADLVYDTLRAATSGGGGEIGGVNPNQVGSGVKVAQIDRQFTPGNLENTGRRFDFAIEGNGFLVVDNGNGLRFTRAGAFDTDESGTLVDPSTGAKVVRFGSVGEADGTNPAFQTPGDDSINIPLGVTLPGQMTTTTELTGNIEFTDEHPRVVVLSGFTFGGRVSPAVRSTFLNDLDINATPYGLGDTIEISGKDRDGNAIAGVVLDVDANTTMGELLDAIETAFAGEAEVKLDDHGNISLEAVSAGQTELSITLADGATNTGGSTFQPEHVAHQGNEAEYPQTDINVVDSLGREHTVNLEFRPRDDTDHAWDVIATMSAANGILVDARIEQVQFNQDGTFEDVLGTGNGDANIEIQFHNLTDPQTITIDLSRVSQNASGSFLDTRHDGQKAETITEIHVNSDGLIEGIAGERRVPIAQLAIASFDNNKGLEAVGSNYFSQSLNSGEPQLGVAGTGSRGTIEAGQLESSNVDIAFEFTRLIIAQRGFSANARTVTVTDEVLEELTNIIR
jgi:flagellar hook protein FlgE